MDAWCKFAKRLQSLNSSGTKLPLLFDLATFLKLCHKKFLTEKENILRENLKKYFYQKQDFLEKLQSYSLLSHAAYIKLDSKEAIYNAISEERLFKALTHKAFAKDRLAIGKMQAFLAFSLIKKYSLIAHINEQHKDSKMGFKASLFENKINKELILGIAGSDLRIWDFDVKDLWCDFLILQAKRPQRQIEALNNFYENIQKHLGLKEIVIVGHSLGGYLAQSLAKEKNIKRIYTFQAPGFSNLDDYKQEYFHIHSLHNNQLKSFKWHNFHFVQKLHHKVGTPIFLNLGTRLHHPSLCPIILKQVLKNL